MNGPNKAHTLSAVKHRYHYETEGMITEHFLLGREDKYSFIEIKSLKFWPPEGTVQTV